MDDKMLAYEGMMLAKKCYSGKYIEKVNITNMSDADQSTQVMAGMLQKFGIAKELIGQWLEVHNHKIFNVANVSNVRSFIIKSNYKNFLFFLNFKF